MKNTRLPVRSVHLYDYSTPHSREETAAFLLDFAARSRSSTDEYWKKMRRYYDGKHDICSSSEGFSRENCLNWTPAQSTDGYIHVETQVIAKAPDFEFNPRDRTDYDKAKQREKIVRYVCDKADLEVKNSMNERHLGIGGTAVWKVCWDSDAGYCGDAGDVTVLSPKPYEIYPDPTSSDVDGCEYIGYVYRMHKQKAARVFERDFARSGETLSDFLVSDMNFGPANNVLSDEYDTSDDTVTVTEWWFRQTSDGKCVINDGNKKHFYEWKAGDIALCIFINGKEIRYIPKYWKNTSFDSFPFVIYSRIPRENSVWGKSELEAIIPLIDAKDRELAYAQLNSAFSSNDIIVMEENALSDGEIPDNSPGSVWKLRPGMMGKVSRLGNIAAAQSSLYSNSAYWQSLIESTTGNFEVNQGKEPTSVTTATGIALLNERAESRRAQKNIGRSEGFKRLYSLIDKTCLEYYNDGRVLRLGAAGEDEFVYSFGGFVRKTREKKYIPELDVAIHTSSAVANSKAFTISALTSLIGMNITKDNYKLVKAYVETIGIPERGEICEFLDTKFSDSSMAGVTAEEIIKIIQESIEKENENE